MAIDRSFTVAGHGTVVTGTVASGSMAVGDELEWQPAGRLVRVRGLERHDRPVESKEHTPMAFGLPRGLAACGRIQGCAFFARLPARALRSEDRSMCFPRNAPSAAARRVPRLLN
jgi:hypothetical protein